MQQQIFPVDTDSSWVINAQFFGWSFEGRPLIASSAVDSKASAVRKGKAGHRSHRTRKPILASMPQEARIIKTHHPKKDELFIDSKAQNWLRFQELVEAWRSERGATSSITDAVLCAAYQSIIGMGKTAVPFILAQLKSEGDDPDQWFWALGVLTGADPVSNDDRGDYLKMAQAWLQWAETSESEYAW